MGLIYTITDDDLLRHRCEVEGHEWKEDYYGATCTKCGMFVPDGHGSWMPLDDDILYELEDDDYDRDWTDGEDFDFDDVPFFGRR